MTSVTVEASAILKAQAWDRLMQSTGTTDDAIMDAWQWLRDKTAPKRPFIAGPSEKFPQF